MSSTKILLNNITLDSPATQPTELKQNTITIPINDCAWDDLFKQLDEPYVALNENLEGIKLKMKMVSMDTIDTTFDTDIIKIKTKNTGTLCSTCQVPLFFKENLLICNACGLEIADTSGTTDDQYTSTSAQDCNVNEKGFMSMRIIGKGAYGNHRSLLKSCAKYGQYRKMTTLKDMHNWNSQSTGKHLPKNVIEEACVMFAKIKDKGKVYRKDVKKGVLSACVYYSCYNNGISKTPTEIAQIMSIAEKFHSAGDRILRDLNERGIIELPNKINPIIDYVERYMEILEIPKSYRSFVLDIIHVADKEKLHVLSDSKNNTKCIGTIYLLIDRVPALRKSINKDRIDKECEISKTTFLKYFNLLCKYYRKFVPVFVRHRIPMKSEWREDIDSPNSKMAIKRQVKAKKPPKMAPNRAKALDNCRKATLLENEMDAEEIHNSTIKSIMDNSTAYVKKQSVKKIIIKPRSKLTLIMKAPSSKYKI